MLQVLAVEWGPLQYLFDTESLTWPQVALCFTVASSVLWLEELRKVFVRALADRSASDEPDRARPPGPRHRSERREHLDELLEAAVEAEIETGQREETVAEAERSLVLRVLPRHPRASSSSCVGISLLVLPGPGLIVIAGGLALMAQDVPFARRWLDKVRERIPEDEDGGIATWVVVLSVTGPGGQHRRLDLVHVLFRVIPGRRPGRAWRRSGTVEPRI